MSKMLMAFKPSIIGITGGIGSGKSYVSHLLRDYLQIPVYDSDTEAKQLTSTHPAIKEGLRALVGANVYDADGILQKNVLAQFLFSDERNAAQVNSVIHPLVKQHFIQWTQRQDSPVVAIESAILFESGFNSLVDWVLYVDAPTEVRLKRAMVRDDASIQQIQARMNRQQAQYYKSEANWVLQNNGSTDEQLIYKLKQIVAEVTK